MQAVSDWKHRFERRDFLDVRALAAKLLNPPDEPVRQVAQLLAPGIRAQLAGLGATPAEEQQLIGHLVAEFNRLIAGPVILDNDALRQLEMRQVTNKWLKRQPEGKDLLRLNKLLLQDIFPRELLHEGTEALGTKVSQGLQFLTYRVLRVGKKRIADHYEAIYMGPDGRRAIWATSQAKLNKKIETLARELLKGNAPATKQAWAEHLRNSLAYVLVIKEVAKAAITGEASVLQFIANAAQAQLAIGKDRPLLPYVHQTLEVMPQKMHRQKLKPTYPKYKVYCSHGRRPRDERTLQVKLSLVERLVIGLPQAQHIADVLIERQAQSQEENCAAVLTEEFFARELDAAKLQAGNRHPSLYCHEVSSQGIEVWLRLQPCEKDYRRKMLTVVRHYFRFLRDHEQAIPQKPKTVADLVPMPEPKRRAHPVTILWFDEIWEIFLNLQDQAAVFFFALGIFAGIHQSEIHRLQWEDITWENDEPIELLVRSFKGPPGSTDAKSRYLRILYPLNKILKLGRGRKGPIVVTRCKPRSFLTVQTVAKRLGIKWDESIMRHTAVSFLLSAGLSLADVAAYLGDREETLSRWYLRRLPQKLAALHWSLPFTTEIFARLPVQQSYYDCTLALKRLELPGKNVREFTREDSKDGSSKLDANWQITTQETFLPPEHSYRGPKRRYNRPEIRWPTDLEFQVMLWEMTPNEIAAKLNTSKSCVTSRADRAKFHRPGPNFWRKYWRLRDAGLPLPLPPLIIELKRILELQRAELAKNGKVVVPLKAGERNTDPEAVITPFGVYVEGKGLVPAPRRQTPLVRSA